MRSKPTLLRIAAYAGLAFLHLPLLFIALYAFNSADSNYSFPMEGLTLRWFARALERTDIHEAIVLSLAVAAMATIIAMVLGVTAVMLASIRTCFGLTSASRMTASALSMFSG